MATVDDKKIIFSMVGVSKAYQQTSKSLKTFISPSFTEQRLASSVSMARVSPP